MRSADSPLERRTSMMTQNQAGPGPLKPFVTSLLISSTLEELAIEYAALAHTITSAPIPPTVVADPDDDAVLACAVAAQAEVIVSGDDHLLSMKAFQRILILTANE